MATGRKSRSDTETFEFTLVISGLDVESAEDANRVYESGCDDATFGAVGNVVTLDFAREAATLEDAISSAIRDAKKAGATVIRVEPMGADSIAKFNASLLAARSKARVSRGTSAAKVANKHRVEKNKSIESLKIKSSGPRRAGKKKPSRRP